MHNWEMSQHIEAEWKTYLKAVYPNGAPEGHLIQCRMAFYGGAHALLNKILVLLTPGKDGTPADERMIMAMHQELARFAASVKAGRASKSSTAL
jgi:hypothetical protein